MDETPQLWIGPVAGRISSVTLEPLTACFDRLSGQTHLLADPLPQLLDILTDACRTTDACVAAFMVQFDMAETIDAVRTRVAECLGELALLGLVEQA